MPSMSPGGRYLGKEGRKEYDMDLERLGRMVAQAQEEIGLTDYALEHEIGRPNGKAFNAAQLDRLKKGQRKLPVPPAVVWQLIRILHLDPVEASEAAGVWPPNVTIDMIRQLDLAAVGAASDQSDPTTGRSWRRAGERRRRDRRHLRLVPQVAA
jgi:hypothetical protein